ncbi:hypothetical protein, partial [Enterobacter roggenkampii]|uniref:hypothetical protein n=4 Tax=Enterobacter TaxID=547 RepID=UPI00197A7643
DLRVMSPTSYQAAPPRVRGCALYSDRLVMQPLFHIYHDFVCKLNDMALFGLFFAQNLPKGMRSHFISPGGLLSSSRGNGQLKDETE